MTYRVVAFNIIDFNVDTAALTQVTPRKSFWTGANYSKRYTPIFGNSLTKATLYANTRWPMDELVELTRYTAAEESAEKYLKELVCLSKR